MRKTLIKRSEKKILEMILSNNKQKEGEALKNLYEEHYFPMRTSYMRQNNLPEDSFKDVFQVSMIVLHKLIKDRKADLSKGSLGGLLTRIIRNQTLKWIRDNRLGKKDTLYDDSGIQLSGDFDQHLIQLEDQEEMLDRISRLGEKCKQILLMFYYERYSIEVISIRMGLESAAAVKQAKYRCIRKLKTYF